MVIIIAGLNVFEDLTMANQVASDLKKITDRLGLPFIFKASFDKANRSSVDSYRGPGLEKGIEFFSEIKKAFDIPIITDVHEIGQVEKISEVADIIQIPAFLCRQTDLIKSACRTNKIVNIKKGQFLAPWDVEGILSKTKGAREVWITERGTSFGYNNCWLKRF